MDEPKPLLAMSPGTKWFHRLGNIFMFTLALAAVSRIPGPPEQPEWVRVVILVFVAVLGTLTLRDTWKSTRGVELDPPGSYEPERYPPEQRYRARMGRWEAVALWGLLIILSVVLLASLLVGPKR